SERRGPTVRSRKALGGLPQFVRSLVLARQIPLRLRSRAIAWFAKMEAWAGIAGVLSARKHCWKWSSHRRDVARNVSTAGLIFPHDFLQTASSGTRLRPR